eukprot:CAMPEP_0174743604 /NCGR_PEP_ID=MMETSP1094-20130205/82061_1 /TAXON_ID=156173 /ORGANISM="Chrysochromulina brevifilum, Strain UTEX LB 985" /LENGTH=81 /DNA_ID=CAMNT_0015947851 /DNA_START=195 /DNA_END=437 /DNA_ORIENTATION=+
MPNAEDSSSSRRREGLGSLHAGEAAAPRPPCFPRSHMPAQLVGRLTSPSMPLIDILSSIDGPGNRIEISTVASIEEARAAT